MDTPITITFRHIDRSVALAGRARELAQRLSELNERITSCHVTIEGHIGHGAAAEAPIQVKFDLSVPGARIHADNMQGSARFEGDAHAALRAAYHDARRQLLDLAHRRSSATRHPRPLPTRESSSPG